MTGNIGTVTAKGQVTIPKQIRDRLGIQESDQLLFVAGADRLVLIPLRRRPLSELYNALPATRPFPGHQAVREQIRTDLGERIARGDE
jgi:AbrB family looped-hinge helix DNA binding protein